MGLALTLIALPAWAQNRDANWAKCTGNDADLRISACTAIIQAGHESMTSFAVAYNNRGIAYSHKNLYDQAIADYSKALLFKPDDADVYINRAWAYHLKGDDAKALPDADKAVALAPEDAAIIETRAEIDEKLGRRDQAVADYRAALRLDPNDDHSKQGLSRLGVAP